MRASEFTKGIVEGGAETWWSDGDEKITLQDVLELTKHIKQINLPINDNLKSKLIHWDGNPEEIERINQVTVSNQFPILVMLDSQGQIDWILDGNHRLHKAIRSQAKTIPAKLIKPGDLDDKAKRVFHVKEQGVTEAPLPPDWDKEQLNLRQTFKNRIKYAVSKAQRLGTGSSRVAFIIPYEGRNTVLKVAKNLKGLAQNEAELEVLNDYVIGQSDIVIPLIDYDKDNKRPVWLQTELASQISMKPLLQLLRTPTLWFLTDAVKYRLALPDKPKYLNKPADLKEKYFDPKMWTYSGEPSEQSFEMFNEYVDKLSELKDSSQIELGDLQTNANWGQFMGRPVVIDLGLSSEVWSKYYLLK